MIPSIAMYHQQFKSFIYPQLNIKTVLFQTIQFIKSTQFSFIWPIDKTLPGANAPSQSGLGSNSNEGVLRIPQSFSITGASPSDFLVSYQDIWCISSPIVEDHFRYSF